MNEKQKITPDYHGLYGDRLEWNTSYLAKLAKTADLRTNITITNGKGLQDNTSTTLGDTMTLQKLAFPSLIKTIYKTSDQLSTRLDFRSRSATIEIHDQAVWQHLRDKKATLTDSDFAQELEKLSKRGISQILAQEKWQQMMSGLKNISHLSPDPRSSSLWIASPISALLGIYSLMTDVKDIMSNPDLVTIAGDLLVALPVIGINVSIMYMTAKSLSAYLQRLQQINTRVREITQPDSYLHQLSDLLPTKHLGGFLRSNYSLYTSSEPLVRLTNPGGEL